MRKTRRRVRFQINAVRSLGRSTSEEERRIVAFVGPSRAFGKLLRMPPEPDFIIILPKIKKLLKYYK